MDALCMKKKETVIKKSSLYYAIKIGNIKLLQLLLEKPNIDVNLGIKEEFSEYKGTEIVQEKHLYTWLLKNKIWKL